MKKIILITILTFSIFKISYAQITKEVNLPKLFNAVDYSYLSDNTMPLSTDDETKKMYLEALAVNWNYIDFKTSQQMMNEVIKSDPIFSMAYAWKIGDPEINNEGKIEYLKKAKEYVKEATESEKIYIEAVDASFKKLIELQDKFTNETTIDTIAVWNNETNEYDFIIEQNSPEIDWSEQWSVQIPYLKKLRSMHPDDFYLNLTLGVCYVQTGNPVKGKHYLYKALSLDKNSPAVRNLLGYSFLEMGNTLRAEQEFDKYISMLPDAANPYDSKGDFYAKTGQYRKAVVMYNKAYSIDNSFEISRKKAEEIRNQLKR